MNSKGEVVGVASRVFGCGDGTPNVYSYIYFYMRYINSILSQTGNSNNWQNFENEDSPGLGQKENDLHNEESWNDKNENWNQFEYPQGHEDHVVPDDHLNTDEWWNDNYYENWGDGSSEPEYYENIPYSWWNDNKGYLENYYFDAKTKNNGIVDDEHV